MKIAISGASGFIGTHLTHYLQQHCHEVIPLSRRDFAHGAEDQLAWLVAECDGVVNLAGAPVDRRWTKAYREELWTSRVEVTRRLVEAVARSENTCVFLSASAVGCYPSVGCYDELTTERGTGFLARLCEAWEAQARQTNVRCVITRFGVVLGPDGGAFARLVRPAKAGAAIVPGGGSQSFSWIDVADLVRAVEYLLTHRKAAGVYNLVAPERTSMGEFTRAVAKHFRSRITLHVPAFALRMKMGEGASVLLDGPCAIPRRLQEAGFRFESPAAKDFLGRI